jgi:hypothetical protein
MLANILAVGRIVLVVLLLMAIYTVFAPNQELSDPITRPEIEQALGQAIIVGITNAIQHQKDDRTFRVRAHQLSESLHWPAYPVQTGIEMLETLERITAQNGSIKSLLLLSHGDSLCLVLHTDNGFYLDRVKQQKFQGIYAGGPHQAFVSDLQSKVAEQKIRFDSNATMVLLSCYGIPLAQELNRITGSTVIAAADSCEPVVSIQNGTESGYYRSNGGFYLIENDTMKPFATCFNPAIYFQYQATTKRLNRRFSFQLPEQM